METKEVTMEERQRLATKARLESALRAYQVKSIQDKHEAYIELAEEYEQELLKEVLNEKYPDSTLKNELVKQNVEQPKEIKLITFNYESTSYAEKFKSLEQVHEVIGKNFPSVWFETKACASLFATLSLKNLNGCPSLNLVGNPSGEKTTVLSFFYNHSLSYISDDFTPRAFVSHSANVKAEELESVDLLPKLKNRVLISPELAPLFEAPKDALLSNFAMLTRVLDGEGLNRDSGVHGHRGYTGDYKFGWLGATTPLKATVWNVMGKIGNRLFFLNMSDKNRTSADYVDMFRAKAYEEKVKMCRGAVKSFLEEHFKKYPVRSLEWDAEQDIFILQEIVKYAQLLSKLRGTLMVWRGEGDDYQHSFPLIEEPPRAINALYNFAKGHALINGRTFLRSEDLAIVRAIAFSSMPHDRFEFLKLLLKHEGKLTTQNLQAELNCSDETARKTMKIFEILGVVTLKHLNFTGGRPMYYVEIKPEFTEILKDTQVLTSLDKPIPSETKGVYDDFSAKKFIEITKTGAKTDNTHPLNSLDKPIPSKLKGVREQEFNPEDAFK